MALSCKATRFGTGVDTHDLLQSVVPRKTTAGTVSRRFCLPWPGVFEATPGPWTLKTEHCQIMELPGVLKPIGSFRHWSWAQLCQTLAGKSGTDSVDDWHSQCNQDRPFGMTPRMITKQDTFPNMLSYTFSMVWDQEI